MATVLLAAMLAIASLATALEVDDKAPDFTLPSTTGKEVSLSQYRGKQNVLLEFFISAASRKST
jgi:peroxiredoxin Q/BCP